MQPCAPKKSPTIAIQECVAVLEKTVTEVAESERLYVIAEVAAQLVVMHRQAASVAILRRAPEMLKDGGSRV